VPSEITAAQVIEAARGRHSECGAVKVAVYWRHENEFEWKCSVNSMPSIPTGLVHGIAHYEAPTLQQLLEEVTNHAN
jgi:hypothetical protein